VGKVVKESSINRKRKAVRGVVGYGGEQKRMIKRKNSNRGVENDLNRKEAKREGNLEKDSGTCGSFPKKNQRGIKKK